MRHLLVGVCLAVGCGGGDGRSDCGACEMDDPLVDAAAELACTADEQDVTGNELTFTDVQLLAFDVTCDHVVLASAADVAAAFPSGAPAEVSGVDFAVDRVVLSLSNPEVRFVVDDGTNLIVGEELLCRGAAPDCVAHIVHGTTRTTAVTDSCPYRGPDPCLAP